MGASTLDLSVEQGSTYTFGFEYEESEGVPFDLTGYQGRGQVRLTPGNATVLGEFVVTIYDPLNGKGKIELPGNALVGVKLPGKSHAEKTRAVYDIEIYNVDRVIRLLHGFIDISPEVTK
jgi:hypothetical protein